MPTEIIAVLDEVGLRAFAGFGIGLLIAYLAAFPVRFVGRRLNILDRPGHRSSHSTDVPRTGGVAIILGMAPALALTAHTTTPFAIGVIAAIVAAVMLPVFQASGMVG